MRLCVLICALFGCASDVMVTPMMGDAGPPPPAETRYLELVGEPDLALVQGATQTLEVRYLDADRAPIPGGTVRFGFEGRAHDSTLSETEAETDELGLARVTLTAATVDATFAVRVRAESAATTQFAVAVSDNGFGRLEVDVRYTGERGIVMRGAGVFPGKACRELLRRERGDQYRLAGPDSDGHVSFVALPAGTPMAVIGRGEGPASSLLAYACVDAVMVDPEEPTSVELVLDDEPLVTMGSYATDLRFGASALASELGMVFDSADVSITASGGEAGLILDEAQRSLLADGAEDAARGLGLARESGLDAELGLEMESAGVGLRVGLEALEELVRAQLAHVDLDGVIRVSDEGLSMEAQSVAAGPGEEELEPLDLGSLSGVVTLGGSVDDEGTSMSIGALSIALPVSQVVRSLLNRELESGDDTRSALMGRLMRCEEMPGLEAVAAFCDRECLVQACRATGAEILGTVESELVVYDELRSRVVLEGEASLRDENADGQVDLFETELDGVWTSSVGGPGAAIEATLRGERILPPP